MAKRKREILKNFFKKGSLPSQEQFGDLIDSMLNIIDEGFDKSAKDGIKIAQIGETGKVISLYKDMDINRPMWTIGIDSAGNNLTLYNQDNYPVLIISPDGTVTLKNKDQGNLLNVEGVASLSGREGNYAKGKVPADGIWHPIIRDLDGCHAFEIMAGVGKMNSGKYALLHAWALNTYNPSSLLFNPFNMKKRIKCHQAYYHSKCCKIKLRWRGGQHNYSLEIKSNTDFGNDIKIQYSVTNLWFDKFMEECREEKI